jgi:DNA-binding SARP family transcriptional activator/WD40 repeat protein
MTDPEIGGLEVRLLGPVELLREGEALHLGGPRQRALLALLALQANEVVPVARIVSALFGPDAPDSAVNAVQAAISRLRRLLGVDVVETRTGGYLLRVDPERLDATRFERLLEEGRGLLRAGEAAAAAAALRGALELFRSAPLSDLASLDFAQAEIRRLDELRLAALVERIEADLAVGRGLDLVAELETLVAEHPLQERLHGQLMLALYRAGRQSEALDVYRETRALLREELGLEPSRALQELEGAILRQDRSLELRELVRDPAAKSGVVVCPFKGLAPFGAADADYFFGRERLVDELLAHLAGASFLGLVGPSGSGKSSLLQAGLLPALAGGALPGSAGWQLQLVRPADGPRVQITPPQPSSRTVVVVDQLEELFTLEREESERAAFLDDLVAAVLDRAHGHIVVVALRADFYGRCAAYPDFASLLSSNHVLLSPMRRDELGRAIEQPALQAGLRVERSLVDALVTDIEGEPGALPLLSTSLLELWRERDGRLLTAASYRLAGGVHGAVARLAEKAYLQLSDSEQGLARAIFLRLAAEEDGTLVRRRVPRDEVDISEEAGRVVGVLTEARLLTASENTIEVSHEALLSEWPRLRAWLDEDRAGRRLRAHLATSAREWAARGRDPGELYRGPRLASALDWTDEREAELNTLEHEFLAASREAHQHELARQRRENRRLRILLGGVAALLLAAVAAGVLALVARSHAQHEATVALARQLGAEAVSEPRIDRAMLLAREAVNLAPSQQTDGTLLATLLRSPAAIGTFTTPITDRPQHVRVSPDGRTIAVLVNTNLMRFYDTATHRQIHVLPALNAGAPYTYLPRTADLFLPQAAHAVAYANPSGVHYSLIDTRTYRTLRTFQLDARFLGPRTANAPVAATPNRRFVFLGYAVLNNNGSDGAAYLDRWATSEGGKPTTVPLRARGMLGLGINRDGRLVVITDGEVSTWDPVSLRRLRDERVASLDNVGGDLAISPDGRLLAYGLPDGTVHFIDLTTGKVTAGAAAHTAAVNAISFSADSRLAASGGNEGLVILWDPRTGQPLERLSGHVNAVFDLAFSGDGKTLYGEALDGTVLEWDLGGSRRFGHPFTVGAWPPSAHSPPPLAISPNGRMLAALASPTSVGVFSTASLRRTAIVSLPHTRQVTALAWAGDDLAVGDNAGGISIFSVARSKPQLVRQLRGLSRTVVAVAASSSTVAAVDGVGPAGVPLGPTTGHLAIWNKTQLVRKPIELEGILHGLAAALAFSRDGSLLAVAARNGPVLIVDPRTGRVERTIQPTPNDAVLTIALSPQGTLATGSYAGIVTLHNPRTGRAIGHPILAGVVISAIAFDPTGHIFTTDGESLWSTSTEQQLGGDFPGGAIRGSAQWSNAAFTPDGKYLFVVFADGSAFRWPATAAAWTAHACTVAGRTFTREEWARYAGTRPYARVCAS